MNRWGITHMDEGLMYWLCKGSIWDYAISLDQIILFPSQTEADDYIKSHNMVNSQSRQIRTEER